MRILAGIPQNYKMEGCCYKTPREEKDVGKTCPSHVMRRELNEG